MAIYLRSSPTVKPPLWTCSPYTVAYNCVRMGLPMPVLAMPMWEGAGNKVYDYSGNQNHGTLSTGVLWSANNLLMDGDDKVTLASQIAFSGSDTWSIVGMLYDTDTTDAYNFWIGKNHNYEGFALRNLGDNLYLRDSGSHYNRFGADEALAPYKNKWTQHIYVADGAGNLKAYLDGLLFDSITPAVGNTQFTIDYIGRGYSNDNYNFHGKVNYIIVFADILTPKQATDINSNACSMFEPIRSPAIWSIPPVGGVAPTSIFYGPLMGPLGGPI